MEVLCKPPVWVDFPVWYPEQVALAVPQKVSWFLRFIIWFLTVASCRDGFCPSVDMLFWHLETPCVGYRSWKLSPCFCKRRRRLRGGTLRVSKSTFEVVPAKHRHQKIPRRLRMRFSISYPESRTTHRAEGYSTASSTSAKKTW